MLLKNETESNENQTTKEISNEIFIRSRKRALGDKNTLYQDQKQRSNLKSLEREHNNKYWDSLQGISCHKLVQTSDNFPNQKFFYQIFTE